MVGEEVFGMDLLTQMIFQPTDSVMEDGKTIIKLTKTWK